MGQVVLLLVLVLMLLASALISGSEVAFFALNPLDKRNIATENTRRSKLVLKLLEIPDQLLATILVANNLVNISIVILSSYIMGTLFVFSGNQNLQFVMEVVIVTFLLLLFGEIIPKVYANRFAPSFSRFMAEPLALMNTLFKPISFFLVHSTQLVNRRFARKKQNLSIDDLSHALELTSKDIPEDREILKGIVKFGHIEVKEIMCPRLDILAVDLSISFSELMKVVFDSGFSRIPVYNGSPDDIRGILYIKDLLPYLNKTGDFNWQQLIRPPYYVPENKKINDLLTEFQANKTHMALAIDEYGGTSGLITMEDILEEIVGEISDESDEEELPYRQIDNNNYMFDAKILLNDFYKILNIKDDTFFDEIKGEADTLAGLILEVRGEIPKQNDLVSYKNFTFRVNAVDKRRIKEIHVSIVNKDEIIEN